MAAGAAAVHPQVAAPAVTAGAGGQEQQGAAAAGAGQQQSAVVVVVEWLEPSGAKRGLKRGRQTVISPELTLGEERRKYFCARRPRHLVELEYVREAWEEDGRNVCDPWVEMSCTQVGVAAAILLLPPLL
jgi:hypothetical protein